MPLRSTNYLKPERRRVLRVGHCQSRFAPLALTRLIGLWIGTCVFASYMVSDQK